MVTTLLVALSLSLAVVRAKKQATSHPVIKALSLAIGCPVCSQLVVEAYDLALAARRNATDSGKKWTEEALLEELETVCFPTTPNGAWLRRVTMERSGDSDIVVALSPRHGRCLSKCWTAADACSRLLDQDELAERLSSKLYKLKGSSATRFDVATFQSLAETACGRRCGQHPSRALELPIAAPSADKQLPRQELSMQSLSASARSQVMQAVGSEAFAPIEEREMEVEEMMERMARTSHAPGGGVDVFSRDEMMDLKDAMRRGDLARVAEIDPSLGAVSDDEFQMMRAMQQEEDASGGDNAAVSPDHHSSGEEDPDAAATADSAPPLPSDSRSPRDAARDGGAQASPRAGPEDGGGLWQSVWTALAAPFAG